jgi:non-specific serine/threonine protein kinase
MRGTIAWSYELLDDDEKTLLNRLSVFSGGCTLGAVETICAGGGIEALAGIESLMDKSLLLQKEVADGENRFRMLEAVKEYAEECLRAIGESDAIRQHHAAYFVALAEEAQPELFGAQQAKWLYRLEEEHDNMRGALRWLLAQDADGALRLAGAVGLFWTLHGHFTEGRRWLEETLQKGGEAVVRSQALIGAGRLAWLQGDYPAARNYYDESLRLARETSNKRQIALASRGLGVVCFLEGDNDAARGFLEESLAIRRELKDKVGISTTLNTLGEVARVEEDYATARKLYEESVALARETGLQEVISSNLNNLGAVAYHERDFVTARASYNEALTISRELGHKVGIAVSLDGCAALALHSKETARGAQLAGASLALYESLGFELETNERTFREQYIAALRVELGEDAFKIALEEGRALSTNDAIALGLRESSSL